MLNCDQKSIKWRWSSRLQIRAQNNLFQHGRSWERKETSTRRIRTEWTPRRLSFRKTSKKWRTCTKTTRRRLRKSRRNIFMLSRRRPYWNWKKTSCKSGSWTTHRAHIRRRTQGTKRPLLLTREGGLPLATSSNPPIQSDLQDKSKSCPEWAAVSWKCSVARNLAQRWYVFFSEI